jgi:hypothetical protein
VTTFVHYPQLVASSHIRTAPCSCCWRIRKSTKMWKSPVTGYYLILMFVLESRDAADPWEPERYSHYAANVKVKLSHAMKTYGKVEVKLHAFLTSALDVDGWSDSRPGRFTARERAPGTHCIGGWVGPRAGLDACIGNHKSRQSQNTLHPPKCKFL